MNPFDTQYNPSEIEQKWYEFWLKEKLFTPTNEKPHKENFCLILPPPNVTGVLHMGHALTCTLEDIIIRRKRMQGYNTLWLPGTDHAGIATQMVVERNLQKTEKKSRHDLGREAFLKKVWEWKEISQNTIHSQLKLIGCSIDWSRLRFTMDEQSSYAVVECFKRLREEGLIYRDSYSMNDWCPRCFTVLSDLEVKHKESKGKLWHILYRFKDNPNQGLTVATTRPETLFGDVAVAVNPKDDRYTQFIGKTLLLPITNRQIPIIADDYVDKDFGTGALKITPAHDKNDFEVGKRHRTLGVHKIFDDKAHLAGDTVEKSYIGLSREKAREKIIQDLTASNQLLKEQEHINNVGHCDRCDTIVEPRLSSQWFVKAEVLAKPAIEAVRKKEIKIIPEEWEKTYFEWMENIRPWCISRQLWWGHRIPVFYCKDCAIDWVTEKAEECVKCKSKNIYQDPDVLDTWFSSGLWPFSTLGWPNKTKDLEAFYPNDVLETGFDILFFWVARMIMLGIKMNGKIPFHTVYLHPMVRDEYGQKMSKTKGNVKDPLDIINTQGADALRFTLAAMAVHGRDVLLSDQRIQGYRNFANKIWNTARFVMMHFSEVKKSQINTKDEINQWILHRLNITVSEVNEALEQYRFFDASNKIYHFLWSEYCDWYLELIKADIESRKSDSTAIEVLLAILKLAHPLMPFITEEIWQKLPLKENKNSISVCAYPQKNEAWNFEEANQNTNLLIEVVETIRSKRGECNLPPSQEITLKLSGEEASLKILKSKSNFIQRLAKAKSIHFGPLEKSDSTAYVFLPLNKIEIRIPREELIDKETEIKKAQEEITQAEAELGRAKQKLQSASFVEKAPEDVIKGVKQRADILEQKIKSLQGYLAELKNS
jgi:valyl-tRNA synthetase